MCALFFGGICPCVRDECYEVRYESLEAKECLVPILPIEMPF